jgi:predicted transposase/invertase (TIGR01784 family)
VWQRITKIVGLCDGSEARSLAQPASLTDGIVPKRQIAPSWWVPYAQFMDDRNLRNPHDRFFYFSFSEVDVARACLLKLLPSNEAKCIDLSTLRMAEGVFINSDLRRSHSDLIYTCRLQSDSSGDKPSPGNEEALIFFLFEHKSYADPHTIAQVLGYVTQVLQRRLRDGQKPCCVIPIVVYHGEKAWDVATTMAEFIPLPDPLAKYIPQLSYILFDVHRTNDDDFRDQSFLHAALLVLKYVRSNDLIRQIGPILELLKSVPNEVRELNRLEAVLVYILTAATQLSKNDLTNALEQTFPHQGTALMSTIAEQLINQGINLGISQGIETGLRKGTLIGAILACQSILGQAQSEAELKAQPLEQLEHLAKQVQEQLRERLNRQ